MEYLAWIGCFFHFFDETAVAKNFKDQHRYCDKHPQTEAKFVCYSKPQEPLVLFQENSIMFDRLTVKYSHNFLQTIYEIPFVQITFQISPVGANITLNEQIHDESFTHEYEFKFNVSLTVDLQ